MSHDLNLLVISGRLTRDPQLTEGQGQSQSRLNFTIASNRAVRDEREESGWREETDFIQLVAFGWVAQRAAKLLKGNWLTAIGRLHTYRYERGEEIRTGFEIILQDFTTGSGGLANSTANATGRTTAGATVPQSEPEWKEEEEREDEVE